jgi:hypothetical protein
MDLPLKPGDTGSYVLSSHYPCPKGPNPLLLPLFLCPTWKSLLLSQWLAPLVIRGPVHKKSPESVTHALSANPPRRVELASKYKQHQAHPQHKCNFAIDMNCNANIWYTGYLKFPCIIYWTLNYSPWCLLSNFVQNQLIINICTSFQSFFSLPFIFMSVPMPVLYNFD